jgi:hypothetical protein
MSKIEERRERRINRAIRENDWNEVSRLLDQQFDNIKRQDRKYHLSSLNAIVKNEGGIIELIDLYNDNSLNPLELTLINEVREYLCRALNKLSEDDRHIFLGKVIYGKSLLELTKETRFKSHKTVKRHFEMSKKLLREELKSYFD